MKITRDGKEIKNKENLNTIFLVILHLSMVFNGADFYLFINAFTLRSPPDMFKDI